MNYLKKSLEEIEIMSFEDIMQLVNYICQY